MVKEYKQQISASPQESYISLVLGFLVVVVSGILLYNFITKRNASEPAVPAPSPTITEEVISTVSGTLTITAPQSTPTAVPSSPTTQPTASPAPTASVTPTATPSPVMTIAPSVTATTTPKVVVSPVPAAATQTGSTHTVQKGESLWKLAEKYYGSGFEWKKIAEANGLKNPRIIEVGQQLSIPSGVQKGADISATATQFPKQYTVAAGDSLWKIAIAQYGTGFEWVYIAKENKLQNPGVIYPGTVLQLPRPHATLDPPGGTTNPPAEGKK